VIVFASSAVKRIVRRAATPDHCVEDGPQLAHTGRRRGGPRQSPATFIAPATIGTATGKPPRPAPIAYQLIVQVAHPVRLTVGRLGECRFPAGRYVYTGSARRALEARVARHLSPTKTLHWHIDHLLAAPGVAVVAVRRSTRAECMLNRSTGGVTIVPGFGASDCRAGCGSHLRYLGPGDRANDA
jgi:Uri superfamily endonuclease